MNRNLILCACGAFMSALFTGCKDTDIYQDPTPQIKQEIENSFDFNAMMECPVTFSVGYKTLVSVYADDPDATENPRKLYAAYTNYDGTFSGTMVLPGEFMGKTVYAKYFQTCLKSVVTAEGVTFGDTNTTRAGVGGETHEAMCKRLRDEYYELLPEGRDNRDRLQNAGKVSFDITSDGTTLNASFLHSGASLGSKLYYYYYKTGTDRPFDQKDGSDKNADVATYEKFGNENYHLFKACKNNGEIWGEWANENNEYFYCVGAQQDLLFYGENYDQAGTKEFPAGYTISFFIKMCENTIGDGKIQTRPLYGEKWLNSYCDFNGEYTYNHIQAAMFKDNGTSSLIFGFEDLPEIYDNTSVRKADLCDKDYNDAIFVITVDFDKINDDIIPDLVEEQEPETETTEGTLLYEDLFPNEGDYDMNDVIIKYKYTKHFDQNNNIVGGIDYEFTPVTPEGSADYVSGFSLMIDSVMEEPRHIFENHKVANRQTFTGTITDNVVGYPKDKVKWDDFNPFIRVADTGREVHLTKKKPSKYANLDGLNEFQRNYVTGKKFPFAMNIPYVDFEPVTERVRIDDEYLLYEKWVSSEGEECTDWYLRHTPFKK